MTARVADARPCDLGEGPLWHPLRQQLFWFDILGRRLLAQGGGEWRFETHVSAAGWVDADRLLVADERALLLLDLRDGTQQVVTPLEADNPVTRSNDGRADPWGGFWIGTMGKGAEPGAGAIWRYFGGELRCLHAGLTIPNAICFPPGGTDAVFTDTPTRQILRQPLDPRTGWPAGDPAVLVDLRAAARNPDGAVSDAAGNLWCAEWGSSHVACYGPDGHLRETVAIPAPHASCPAFGGPDLRDLYCTTAREGLSAEARAAAPLSGQLFVAEAAGQGRAEPRVALPQR